MSTHASRKRNRALTELIHNTNRKPVPRHSQGPQRTETLGLRR